jgi:hypothetical protein
MISLSTATFVFILIAILASTSSIHVSDARLHNNNLETTIIEERSNSNKKKNEIVVTRIEPIDEEHERRLLTCNDYQYKIRILDTLFMYYVANAETKSMSMKLEYLGTAWISLGINKNGKGDMIGSEAWLALPGVRISDSNPGIYPMKSESVSGVILSTVQMLKDGTIEQGNGITSTTFTRKYKDFFLINQPINNTGSNEFVWAYGFSNAYTSQIHQRAGHFTLAIEECVSPKAEIEEIDKRKGRRSCGLLNLSIFCPLTQCGVLGRFIGLC